MVFWPIVGNFPFFFRRSPLIQFSPTLFSIHCFSSIPHIFSAACLPQLPIPIGPFRDLSMREEGKAHYFFPFNRVSVKQLSPQPKSGKKLPFYSFGDLNGISF